MNLTTEQLKRFCELLERVEQRYNGISTDRAMDLVEIAVSWHAAKEKELRDELERLHKKPTPYQSMPFRDISIR